jgi:L-alanine-DL-glutamate epimerase-like enolase superfamily enzyme
MKINSVEIIPVTIPLQVPIRHAFAARTSGLFVIVKMATDEGFEGIGCGSVLYPGYIGDSQESVMAKVKGLAKDVLLGANPLDTEQILNKCDSMLFENSITKTHVDFALYDLKGKILNVPVYELLGGLGREKIPLEWIVTLDDPDAQAEAAVRFLKAGFHSLKLKVGGDPAMAVKRFRTVRKAVGDNVEIGIDMDDAYRAHDALQLIEELSKYHLHFAEQPLARYDVDGFVAIKSRTNIPLVADDSAWSIQEAYALIQRRAVDMFHLAPDRIGGFRKCLQFRALVEAAHLDYAISTYNSTGISHAAATHFAIACSKRAQILDELGNVLYFTGGTDSKAIIRPEITKEINAPIEKGFVFVPKGPGLGIDLNEDLVNQYLTPGLNRIVIQ